MKPIERLGRTRHTRLDHQRKINELVDRLNELTEVVFGLNQMTVGDGGEIHHADEEWQRAKVDERSSE